MNESTLATGPTGPQIAPRKGAAFQGVARLMWAQQFTLRAMVPLVLGVGGLAALAWMTDRDELVNWIERFMLMTFIPIVAFEAGAKAVREDLKPGAVDYVITRPLPRWLYVVFKYVAQLAMRLTKATLGFFVIVALVKSLGVEVDSIGLWWGGLASGVAAFIALGFMMGALTSRYLIQGLFYAGLIEGALGNIPIQLNKLSILRHLRELLGINGEAAVASSLGFLILIAAVLVSVAAGLFSMKEFIGEKGGDS